MYVKDVDWDISVMGRRSVQAGENVSNDANREREPDALDQRTRVVVKGKDKWGEVRRDARDCEVG